MSAAKRVTFAVDSQETLESAEVLKRARANLKEKQAQLVQVRMSESTNNTSIEGDEKSAEAEATLARRKVALCAALKRAGQARVDVAQAEAHLAETEVRLLTEESSSPDNVAATAALARANARLAQAALYATEAKEVVRRATYWCELFISSPEVELCQSEMRTTDWVAFVPTATFAAQVDWWSRWLQEKTAAGDHADDDYNQLVVPIIDGAVGIGKASFGKELCAALAQRHEFVKTGTVRTARNLPERRAKEGEPVIVQQEHEVESEDAACLARALVLAFCQAHPMLRAYTLRDVVGKFKHQFGDNVVILLHVHHYSQNMEGVQALIRGAARAWKQVKFCVVPVLTGKRHMDGSLVLPTASLSSAAVTTRVTSIKSLVEEGSARVFERNIFTALGISSPEEAVDRKILVLMDLCDGFPAGVTTLVSASTGKRGGKEIADLGAASAAEATAVYTRVLDSIRCQYTSDEWRRFFYSRTPQYHPLLHHVALVVMAGLPVEGDDLDAPVLPPALRMENDEQYKDIANSSVYYAHDAKPEATYRMLQRRGFVDVREEEDEAGKVYYVYMPFIAMCVINESDTIVDWDVLRNPFEETAVDAEVFNQRLIVASLALRIKALKAVHDGQAALIPVTALRPGAMMLMPATSNSASATKKSRLEENDADAQLMVRLPDTVTCLTAGTPLVAASSFSNNDGTIVLLLRTGAAAVDGAAVFTGTQNGEDVVVLWLCKHVTDDADAVNLHELRAEMKQAGEHLLKKWLGKRKLGMGGVVLVYDVFTAQDLKETAASQCVFSPSAASTCEAFHEVMFVTEPKSLRKVVGPALHLRHRLHHRQHQE